MYGWIHSEWCGAVAKQYHLYNEDEDKRNAREMIEESQLEWTLVSRVEQEEKEEKKVITYLKLYEDIEEPIEKKEEPKEKSKYFDHLVKRGFNSVEEFKENRKT